MRRLEKKSREGASQKKNINKGVVLCGHKRVRRLFWEGAIKMVTSVSFLLFLSV